MGSLWKYDQPTSKKRKASADRDWQKKREICRYKVFRRADGCCERCGRPLILKPSAARHEFDIANINEEPPRSKGGDPLNPDDCVCLCCHCHKLVTENRIYIEWKDPALKARGGSLFRKGSGKWQGTSEDSGDSSAQRTDETINS